MFNFACSLVICYKEVAFRNFSRFQSQEIYVPNISSKNRFTVILKAIFRWNCNILSDFNSHSFWNFARKRKLILLFPISHLLFYFMLFTNICLLFNFSNPSLTIFLFNFNDTTTWILSSSLKVEYCISSEDVIFSSLWSKIIINNPNSISPIVLKFVQMNLHPEYVYDFVPISYLQPFISTEEESSINMCQKRRILPTSLSWNRLLLYIDIEPIFNRKHGEHPKYFNLIIDNNWSLTPLVSLVG